MKNMKKLFGVTTAMITPFTEEGMVDYEALSRLTEMLIEKGVNCLYPCGTTGEMLRLTVEERKSIAKTVIDTVGGRVNVFIHCGCMNQEDTMELVKHAKEAGADGVGVVTPAFFGANERELLEYYRAVSKCAGDFPVYLYNIPQCAGNDLTTEAAEKLAVECPNIIGIKYSYSDMNRTVDYTNVNGGSFSVLHGCDRLMVSMLAAGCDGIVSGTSSAFPEPFAAVWRAWEQKDTDKAMELQKICVKFCDILKGGTNLSYYKTALRLRGIPVGDMRRPQLDIGENEAAVLEEALEGLCREAGICLRAEG